ncbi:MAG: hypothetical protein ACREK5_06540 [Gemmatimonadota bacterium]
MQVAPEPDVDVLTEELDVTVVVLLEAGRLGAREIYDEYEPSLRRLGLTYEFLFIAEPGSAGPEETMREKSRPHGKMRILEVGQPVGQSAVLRLSVEHSRGRIIVTLPPAFRVAPDALPGMIRRIQEGSDVVVARRWPRRDGWINRLQGGLATWLMNSLTGSRFQDLTCRVSAMRRDVLSEIPLYGSQFRFLPIIAEREGFRVKEEPVAQHPRGGQTRVYRPGVYLGWVIDILGIFFLLRFTYSPLRFFGSVGAVFGLLGGGILSILVIQRFGGQPMADRPMMLLGVLLVTLGVQAVALGLIGEIVVHFQASQASTYRLDRDDGSKASEDPRQSTR